MADLFDLGIPAAKQEEAGIAAQRGSKMTRGQKREAIAELLRADASRSDREIARLAGCDHKTVAALRRSLPSNFPNGEIDTLKLPNGETKLPTAEAISPPGKIEARQIPHRHGDGEIETPHADGPQGAEIAWSNAAEATIAICGITALWSEAERAQLIAALDQQQCVTAALSASSTITVSWSAIRAAKALCHHFDIAWLDKFCEGLANGKIPRMSIAEKQRLWGTTNGLMPRTIELDASDPVAAAQRILSYWGHRGKIDTLGDEIKRRTKPADPERPKYGWRAPTGDDGEDDIPF